MRMHTAPKGPSEARDAAPGPVRVGVAPDGALTYFVGLPPEALPPVRSRDLSHAWEAAHQAATAQNWSVPRAFRFRRDDGTTLDVALTDPDARCWAGAVDATVGMRTAYGLSLCLRLLALIELLTRARWVPGLLALEPDGAELHPDLLRIAATISLAGDARFDETGFRARLGQMLAPPGP
jgi:hypothetical protein